MPKLPIVKTKELLRVLEKLGFIEHHHVGSHAQFKHADGRRTTVPIHTGDVQKGMLHGILQDIRVSTENFIVVLKKKK
jgi:predicted RNA binding protein YcfA (HicA-like mRNA interferase family)